MGSVNLSTVLPQMRMVKEHVMRRMGSDEVCPPGSGARIVQAEDNVPCLSQGHDGGSVTTLRITWYAWVCPLLGGGEDAAPRLPVEREHSVR